MTEEEYETKIGELELQIENMELTFSLHAGLITTRGFSYIAWHSWVIAGGGILGVGY